MVVVVPGGVCVSVYVCVCVKLQALVYDILPWRKVSESDARSVRVCVCVFVSVSV